MYNDSVRYLLNPPVIWENSKIYEIEPLYSAPDVWWAVPLVIYEVDGAIYYLNDPDVKSTLGLAPPLDSAWTKLSNPAGAGSNAPIVSTTFTVTPSELLPASEFTLPTWNFTTPFTTVHAMGATTNESIISTSITSTLTSATIKLSHNGAEPLTDNLTVYSFVIGLQ